MDFAGIATMVAAIGTSCGGLALLVRAFRSPSNADDVKDLQGQLARAIAARNEAQAEAADADKEAERWRTRAGIAEAAKFHAERVCRFHGIDPNEELPE